MGGKDNSLLTTLVIVGRGRGKNTVTPRIFSALNRPTQNNARIFIANPSAPECSFQQKFQVWETRSILLEALRRHLRLGWANGRTCLPVIFSPPDVFQEWTVLMHGHRSSAPCLRRNVTPHCRRPMLLLLLLLNSLHHRPVTSLRHSGVRLPPSYA